jgi:DNA processing protein
MKVTDAQRRLLALCAIRVGNKGVDWSLIAREAMRPGGLDELEAGRIEEKSPAAVEGRKTLRAGLKETAERLERVQTELDLASGVGARLVTVLDPEYPANLRLIFNLPPFLFLRGTSMQRDDARSVAVVGTRDASAEGINKARKISERLVESGVVVVSGLARGIDTAAHTATLAVGGRTIAVIGTGITRTFPAENRELADEIAESGLIASQFWPSASPAKWTFPRRNVVMSGIAQGTVVVEASSTSGAKMQARLALEHGKRVFLLKSLVTAQPWARTYVDKRGALEVESIDDIVSRLADPGRIRQITSSRQLTLELA